MKSGKDSGWQRLEEAAMRLGRSAGHLRRLCPDLSREGKARIVAGRGVRSFWQIRDNVELKPRRHGSELPVGKPFQAQPNTNQVQIIVGDLTITIQLGAPAPSPRPTRE